MAKGGFSIQWNGFDRMIREAPGRLADTKGLLDALGEMLVSSTHRRFEEERGPDGKPWPKSRRAEAEAGKTLQDKGILRKSVEYDTKFTANAVYVGSNTPYARIQQLGGEIKAKNKPYLAVPIPGGGIRLVKSVTITARPYIGVSKEDIEEAKALLKEFMADAFSVF